MKNDFVINSMEKGYIQIYTGDGKGKTTAALGLAVRAAGAGLKVYIGEFIKEVEYSEIRILRERFPEIDVEFYKEADGDIVSFSKTKGNRKAAKKDSHRVRETTRSGGTGLKGRIMRFIKEEERSDLESLQKLFPEIDMETCKKKDGGNISSEAEDNYIAVRKGFDRVREVVMSGEYNVIVLDELTIPVLMSLIKEKDVLNLMKDKPEDVELVITGRHATKRMIKAADLVSEVKEVRHYYSQGVLSRKGIEC